MCEIVGGDMRKAIDNLPAPQPFSEEYIQENVQNKYSTILFCLGAQIGCIFILLIIVGLLISYGDLNIDRVSNRYSRSGRILK